jgi:predicted transcriptional regulator
MENNYNREGFYGASKIMKCLSRETNLRIMSIIKHNPGISGAQIIERMYCESSTVYNILRKLRAYDLIRYEKNKNKTIYSWNDALYLSIQNNLIQTFKGLGDEICT